MNRTFLYIEATCVNIDGPAAVVGGRRVELDKSSRAVLDVILAGGNRLDVLARQASSGGGTPQHWAAEFTRTCKDSPLVGVHRLAFPAWPRGTTLVCDWLGEFGDVSCTCGKAAFWRRKPSERDDALQLGGQESLFFLAQILRGMLGATSRREIVLLGSADRVLFGDLVFRHRATVVLAPTWPEGRRVWHASPDVLQEDTVWLEHYYYALRHCDESSAGDLSARSSSVLAAQEIRALCDARSVMCWSAAQKKELLELYGRRPSSVSLIRDVVADTGNPTDIVSNVLDSIVNR